jgi:hypothetical protein
VDEHEGLSDWLRAGGPEDRSRDESAGRRSSQHTSARCLKCNHCVSRLRSLVVRGHCGYPRPYT